MFLIGVRHTGTVPNTSSLKENGYQLRLGQLHGIAGCFAVSLRHHVMQLVDKLHGSTNRWSKRTSKRDNRK
ncbi:hypothetical protein HZ326_14371 [Fusarium oxysporum f. sp. albedinis]|nr:hypothetical protein HZ326_14371 [Fusarium oxysporum f. sp. albedinis]